MKRRHYREQVAFVHRTKIPTDKGTIVEGLTLRIAHYRPKTKRSRKTMERIGKKFTAKYSETFKDWVVPKPHVNYEYHRVERKEVLSRRYRVTAEIFHKPPKGRMELVGFSRSVVFFKGGRMRVRVLEKRGVLE